MDSLKLYFEVMYKRDMYYVPFEHINRYLDNKILYYQGQYIIYHLEKDKIFYTIVSDNDNIPILIDNPYYVVKYYSKLIPIEDNQILLYFFTYIDRIGKCKLSNVCTSNSLFTNTDYMSILSTKIREQIYEIMFLDKWK